MWRILLFLIAVVVLAFLCIFVLDQHGVVSLALGSRVYEASLAVTLAALSIAVLAAYLVIRLLMFLLFLPAATFQLSRSRRKAKGAAAIASGLVAAASGDLHATARHARIAERLASHEPLALLLKAQAAQLRGDRTEAHAAFTRMAQLPDTKGLGLRGLFVEARRRGDGEAAHRHAAQAAKLDVFLPWAHEATLVAQCRTRDWMAALATLERNHRLGAMDVSEMRHAKAALLAARALDLRGAEPGEALKAAFDALKIEPGLTPAAATAAWLLARGGQQRKAMRIIEAAWRLSPHPDLAEAYLGLRAEQSAAERLKQVAKLAALLPDHEESRVALGRVALAARDFPRVRSALAPLADGRPTARVCLLMAEIEEAEHGMTGLARQWLARAAHAPRDPAWIADGVVSPQWAAVAPESGRIGAYSWERPPELPAGTGNVTAVPMPVEAPRAVSPVALAADAASGRERAGPANEPAGAAPSPIELPRLGPPAAAPASEAPGSGDPPAPGVNAAATPEAAPPKGGDLEAAAPPRIETVAFPLDRAPDDPGADRPVEKGLWRRLTG